MRKCSECRKAISHQRQRRHARTCSPECSKVKDRKKARIRMTRARRKGLTLPDRAYNLALRTLRGRHPEEFRALYQEAREELSTAPSDSTGSA